MPQVESEGLAFEGRLVLVVSLQRPIEYAFFIHLDWPHANLVMDVPPQWG